MAHSKPAATPHTDKEIRDRRRSIRLLRDAIDYEANEERRFVLAEELEQLEAEEDELELGSLRQSRP